MRTAPPHGTERRTEVPTTAPKMMIQTVAPARTEDRVRTILVVDDDAMLRQMLSEGLAVFGYRTETAENVAAAIELLRTRCFHLILCDYQMPSETGLELLNYVSEVHPDLPFIMCTGHDESELASEAIHSGALDFVAKPFRIPQLIRVLEQNWARLDRDSERVAQRENAVLEGTIRALVAAVDAKDPYTACHSERVAVLALHLGKAIGLTPDRLRILEFAALMHDVGKIAVPSSILRKAGELTPEEWVIIRSHPARSAEIVAQVGALGEVATIVRHHHERMDGDGYPDGLAGEAIPYLSRLLAVVDTYEALTSARAYRPALQPEKALEIIRQGLGTHFDQALGEVFLNLQDRP